MNQFRLQCGQCSNEHGFLLTEAVVSAAILGIVSLAFMSLISLLLKNQSSFSRTAEAYQVKNRVMRVFIKDGSWEETIRANVARDPTGAQTHFTSFYSLNVSPPTNGPFSFPVLRETSSGDYFDDTGVNAGHAGFDSTGERCNTFGLPDPQNRCRYRWTFRWEPICGSGLQPPTCPNPTALIRATAEYDPGPQGRPINVRGLDFVVQAGTPLVDLIRNCHRLGGDWIAAQSMCDYNIEYCSGPQNANTPMFRGWNLDGTPVCEAVIKPGNATQNDGPMTCGIDQVVRGVRADGSLVCGAPLKKNANGVFVNDVSLKCPADQRQIGSNLDGSPICVALIERGIAGSSGQNYCDSGQRPNGVYADGTLRCAPINDIVNGQYACNAGERVAEVYPNGTVRCVNFHDVQNGVYTCPHPTDRVVEVYANGTLHCEPDPTIDVRCNAGSGDARVSGFDSNGTPICNYIRCPPGDTLLDFLAGSPVCQRSVMIEAIVDITIPGRRSGDPERTYETPHSNCPMLNGPPNSYPLPFPTRLQNPSSELHMTEPDRCTHIYGAREPWSDPSLRCYDDTVGNYGVTYYPHAYIGNGTLGDPDYIFLFVVNHNYNAFDIRARYEGRCAGTYIRYYP